MMDFSASLQTPRTPGRSRFSKALPAPPPTLDSMLTPRQMPSSPAPPPPPPPKESTVVKPLSSPLPPLPLKANGSQPMSIPRRPVAVPPPADEPSPVTSISSLLSAYSRTSAESTLRSSEGTASTKTSYIAPSPGQSGLEGDFKKQELLTPLSSVSPDYDSQKGAQDGRKPFIPGLPRSPLDSTAPAISPGGLNNSTNSPQLWRRRSLKSEKGIAVSELKLMTSHGSTASSQQPAATATSSLVPPFANPTLDSPAQTTRSPVGLPGRNIRPVASREPVAQTPEMGHNTSKTEANVNSRLGGKDVRGATAAASEQPNAGDLHLPIQRLPTPDYDQHDVKSPLFETVASPISPASSPELASKESETRPPIVRKAVGAKEVRQAKSTTSLKAQPTGTLTSPPDVPPLRSPLRPSDPAATRERAAQQTQFPARTSSRTVEPPKVILRRQPAEAQPLVPPPAMSRDSGTDVEELSQERIKAAPHMSLDTAQAVMASVEVDEGERSPGADHPPFPVSFTEMAPLGTVFPAPPLGIKNFHCWQGHKQMFRDRNIHCPLSCQTCQRQDTELRWKCKWCFLRICQPCMDYLHENQRDLQRLLDHIKEKPAETQSPTDSSSQTVSPHPVVQEA